MPDAIVYKILTRMEWSAAESAGVFAGSAVDLQDGFIHFSSKAQVAGTAAKHFAGQQDLLLLGVAVDKCPPGGLRWEPSRDEQLFPHLYCPLDVAWVVSVEPLPVADA